MKKISIPETGTFKTEAMTVNLLHDSPYFKIINFNFEPGQELPVHSHDIEGQVSIMVLEGRGEFLSSAGSQPAEQGDILICDIAEGHGIKAISRMRVVATIAPPI